jgi:hypothetical protein
LQFHPHVHAIVTAGGLGSDSQWLPSSMKYLFPVHVMGALLRGKMMGTLRQLHARGTFAGFDDFDDPEGFDRLMTRLAGCRWHVYAKKPFREALHVLRYLGRYTHRVAISSSRLVAVSDQAVTFRTGDGKTVTLSPVESCVASFCTCCPTACTRSATMACMPAPWSRSLGSAQSDRRCPADADDLIRVARTVHRLVVVGAVALRHRSRRDLLPALRSRARACPCRELRRVRHLNEPPHDLTVSPAPVLVWPWHGVDPSTAPARARRRSLPTSAMPRLRASSPLLGHSPTASSLVALSISPCRVRELSIAPPDGAVRPPLRARSTPRFPTDPSRRRKHRYVLLLIVEEALRVRPTEDGRIPKL